MQQSALFFLSFIFLSHSYYFFLDCNILLGMQYNALHAKIFSNAITSSDVIDMVVYLYKNNFLTGFMLFNVKLCKYFIL